MAVFKTLAFLLVISFETMAAAADANSSFSFDGFAKSPSFDKNADWLSESEPRASHLHETHQTLPRKDNASSGLGFLLKKEIVAVEFGISKRGNRVGILVGRPESAKIRNFSSFDGHFHGEKRLNCWINYEASSKRVDVRLSVSTALKPVDPFVSYSVDLAKLWKGKNFIVGLTSSNGNSCKPHYLHSWSFGMRHPSMRIHSQPLDPNAVSKTVKEEVKTVEVKQVCLENARCIGSGCGLWKSRSDVSVIPLDNMR
ncbi:unnamed protein product [Brassica rapa subsp. narinosa]|uniref:Legume lectin domain-containing protein n=1 Tax=Brassica oleracea TaxID=3712 RepID=A0A3P6AAF4_BRAOL|nr:unnamed protein product [Brassica oleracea]